MPSQNPRAKSVSTVYRLTRVHQLCLYHIRNCVPPPCSPPPLPICVFHTSRLLVFTVALHTVVEQKPFLYHIQGRSLCATQWQQANTIEPMHGCIVHEGVP
jgi:hypothetical protein